MRPDRVYQLAILSFRVGEMRLIRRDGYRCYRRLSTARGVARQLINRDSRWKGRIWIENYHQPASRHQRSERGLLTSLDQS